MDRAIRWIIEAACARPDESDLVDRLREEGDWQVSLVAVEIENNRGLRVFSRMNAPFLALGFAPLHPTVSAGIGSRLTPAGL